MPPRGGLSDKTRSLTHLLLTDGVGVQRDFGAGPHGERESVYAGARESFGLCRAVSEMFGQSKDVVDKVGTLVTPS